MLDLISCCFPETHFEVFRANCGREALQILAREHIDLAILDYSLADCSGTELFHQVRRLKPGLPMMFLTGYPNVETAVSLMKAGACDYVTKPFNTRELFALVCKTLKKPNVPGAKKTGLESDRPGAPLGSYVSGNSAPMKALEIQIRTLPRYPDTSVLITGPTGTGKSLAARHIHDLTWGQDAPFVEIDCSTIPRELCESELFGHEKGAFTGAHCTKIGLFEAAGKGTAFLDEIGELDLALQAKFLRVLEARHFKRVGGHTTQPMGARIIAATNRSLPDMVRNGQFREDLYFRLNVFEMWMPPLKERGDDILTLALHFLRHFAGRHQKPILDFTPEALDYLRNCDFPGNLRELRNLIERAVINSEGPMIEFSHLVTLRPTLRHSGPPPEPVRNRHDHQSHLPVPGHHPPAPPHSLNLAETEKQKLTEALRVSAGNKSKAARLVGLSRTAFHRRLKKYDAPAPARPKPAPDGANNNPG